MASESSSMVALPLTNSICNILSKEAQLRTHLISDLLDKIIEQYTGYYRMMSAISQGLKNTFAALFNGLSDDQVEIICNKKLGLPDGTKSTPHDLLRMAKFEGVMVFARDLSASSEDLELKGHEFYKTHLASLVDEEFEMQLRVALKGKVGECSSIKVANHAGRELFGLHRRWLKFPLTITSFCELQHTLKTLIEFIIWKNHREGGSELRSRYRATWHTKPTLLLVREFLQSKAGALPPCGEGSERDEADESGEVHPQAGGHIDDEQFDASFDPVEDCYNDRIAAAPDPVQRWLTHEKIELRKQKKDVDPKAADPVDGYKYWEGALEGSIEAAQQLIDVIPFLDSPEIVNDEVWMTTQDTIKYLCSPFVVRRVHDRIVK